MVDKYTDDKAKYRTVGVVPYDIDDRIGRDDGGIDKTAITNITASGVITLLPASPLGRRNYISVKNTGSVDVEIFNSTTSSGITVAASGGTWEENASGSFYIKSTGADSAVTVYERSSR